MHNHNFSFGPEISERRFCFAFGGETQSAAPESTETDPTLTESPLKNAEDAEAANEAANTEGDKRVQTAEEKSGAFHTQVDGTVAFCISQVPEMSPMLAPSAQAGGAGSSSGANQTATVSAPVQNSGNPEPQPSTPLAA